MKKYDILIIGGGPAAITIAKILGKKMSLGIIRPEDHSMIYCAMPYAIEKIIRIEKTLKKDDLVTDAGADLIRDKVEKIDFDQKVVITEKHNSYEYEKLVIATGAIPFIPEIPGKDLNGVMTFKTEEDMKKIISLVDMNKISKAVVVGAGAIGVELSQAFSTVGIETHLVDMEGTILNSMMDEEMVQEAEEELIKKGIQLHLNTKVTELKGNEYIDEVLLDKGPSIIINNIDDCSTTVESEEKHGLVVFAAGMVVERTLFNDHRLKMGRDGIIINDRMETTIPDVFAVGDCAQFSSGITGEIIQGKLATNAVPMAKTFAFNQMGIDKRYPGFYNGAATKIGSFYAGGTGFTEKAARKKFDVVTGDAELTTKFPNMPGAKKIKIKMIADRKTLKIIGCQFLSGEAVTDKVDTLTLAIQNNLSVADCADLSYSSQPYQSFFPANNIIVAAAEDIMRKLD